MTFRQAFHDAVFAAAPAWAVPCLPIYRYFCYGLRMSSARNNRIGIDVDDLRLSAREGLKKAAAMAFRAVELGAAQGEVCPDELGSSGRRELKRYVEGLGLELASLSAEMPRLRLTDLSRVEERIERTQGIIELARSLDVRVVTTGVGALIDLKTGRPSEQALEAIGRMGEYADARGVHLALRPSYDAGARWVSILKAVACPSLKVCLDPGALVMTGANPLESIERFIEQVTLVHARDATAGFSDPQGGEPRLGHETALGDGDVDLVGVLGVLREAEYRGAYILRRIEARDPQAELIAARAALESLL